MHKCGLTVKVIRNKQSLNLTGKRVSQGTTKCHVMLWLCPGIGHQGKNIENVDKLLTLVNNNNASTGVHYYSKYTALM